MSEWLSFHLSDDFIEPYKTKEVPWGFQIGGGNSLSELTFIIKYSRKKEDGTKERWWEVCQRCVEGMYSIFKDHAKYNKTNWNDLKAQKSAQDAFDRMFNFKWTPPGRGLQHMGTKYIAESRNGARLINCSALSTEKISTHSAYDATMPFVRLMEMSMNGIGCGFDTRGAGNITLHQPLEEKEVYVIEDTREAWAASTGALLETFFFKNRKTLEFDYSPIRPEGSILKSFGGTASGPGPLIRMHEKITELLSNREGELITDRDIVDICNLEGKAAVAGGARRSALLSLGFQTSSDYINLKNWELPENAERTGPDGWAWACLPDETWVQTDCGAKQIKELIETPFTALLNGKPFEASGFVKTGVAAPIYNLETNEGYSIKATNNHPFMMDDGSWRKLEDLKAGDFIQINDHGPLSWDGKGSFDEGYLLGHLWGDGALVKGTGQGVRAVLSVFDKEICEEWTSHIESLMAGIGSPAKFYSITGRLEKRIGSKILGAMAAEYGMVIGNKKFNHQIESIASSSFCKGVISAAFDTDGHVQANGDKQGFSLVLSQSDLEQLKLIQRILLRLGIKSTIRKANKAGEKVICDKLVMTQDSWTLAIGSKAADLFMETIGLSNPLKRDRAIKLVSSNRNEMKNVVRVSSIVAAGYADVYDTTIEDIHAFDANGFIVHNSNNSIAAGINDDLSDLVEQIAINGEPGIIWPEVMQNYGRLIDPIDTRDTKVNLTNPCGEIQLEGGGELCNLSELYPTNHDSIEDFKQSIKHAYMYSKSVTLLGTPWAETNEIIMRNRRIGVSMTGVAQFIETRGWNEMKNWMNEGYRYISAVDVKYSSWLGIRESVRITTIKPAGSTSLLAGVTPGVHWPTTGDFHIRRVRFLNTDPLLEILKAAGYIVEPDINDPIMTAVASFPTSGVNMRSEREVSVWEKASLAALAQRYWSDNMVSCTLSFTQKEIPELAPLLNSFQGQLKGVSFLPINESGTSYAQAPYEPLNEVEALEWQGRIIPIPKDLLYQTAGEFEEEKFCNSDSCVI